MASAAETKDPDATTTPPPGRARILSLAPIIPVRSISVSLPFYLEVLRFELRQRNSANTSALVARDQAQIMLMALGDLSAVRATGDFFSAYLRVSDLDDLYRELRPGLERLHERRFRPPHSTGYGTREMHVRDPDGFLIFFSEPISA
ncbi:MAG: VOC family protein [Pseudomonadota bacterium]